ncbi:hypothetical protein Pfra02_44380 [Pseudomonas fragi]|nr:hypothetical protein Pfra02_44380 [Pseudomonas fragi]
MKLNNETIVANLNGIVGAASYVGVELKPYAVNAVSLFLMELNASGTIDQGEYGVLINKLNTDGATNARKHHLQNENQQEFFNLIIEAANLEQAMKTIGADKASASKLLLDSEFCAFIHHAHNDLSDGILKKVEYDFLLNWVDSVVYPY